MIRTLLLLLIGFIKQHFNFGLGVDFGGEYSKASMLLPGRYFVMVEDSISKRKTPTSISFCDNNRFFEHQSLKKFAKKKCDSFRFLNRFFNDENSEHMNNYDQQGEQFRDNFTKSNDDLGTLLSMRSSNLPPLEQYPRESENENEFNIRLEEIQGMLLKNLKQNTERTTDVQFKNVVYTLPDNNVSIEQRKRIASSILMAGMTPTAFVSENTAASVFYALSHHSLKPDINENVLLINIGASGVKINVMNIENMKEDPSKEDSVIYPKVTKVYDRFFSNFNGNKLDYCFMNYTLNKHHEKQNENLLSDLDRTRFFKLFGVARKPKEILSINKTYKVKLDNFFEHLPLSAKVLKTEYEQTCQNDLEVLREIFQKVKQDFEEQNIKFDKLEVIGGVVRMPVVKDMIQAEFEMQPASHINGDDSPCQGAAFMAANYSAGVKTKRIQIAESPNYHVEYQIKNNDKEIIQRQDLFKLGTPQGTKQILQLEGLKDDLEVDIYVPEQDYHMNVKINGTDGLEEKMKDKNITDWKGVLNFELDLLGIPKLSFGMVYINETVTERYNTTKRVLKKQKEETEVKDKETEVKDKETIDAKDEEQEATEEKKDSLDDQTLEEQQDLLQDQQANNSTNTTVNENNNSTDTKNDTKATNKTKAPEYEYVRVEEERQVTKTHKIKLNLSKSENIKYLVQNKEEFEKSKKFLNDIQKFEEDRRKLLMKKNELESFVYKLKEMVNNEDSNKFLNDEEKDSFMKRSEEIDDYMFSPEIDVATFQNITDKINDINELINPFKTRQQEYQSRDLLFNVTMERFSNQTQAITKIQKRKTWIPEDRIKEVNAYLYEVRQNITDLYKRQQELEMHMDPVHFNVTVVKEYDQRLDSKIKDLRRIPKPKNETNSDSKENKPNMEELLKNMDPSKLNMNKEQLEEMMKNMKDNLNMDKLDEMKEKLEKFSKDFENIKGNSEKQDNTETVNDQNNQENEQNEQQDQEGQDTEQMKKEEQVEEDIIDDM